MAGYVLIQVLVVSLVACMCNSSPANIVLLLTDDQDLMLGGTAPMTFTKSFLQVSKLQLINRVRYLSIIVAPEQSVSLAKDCGFVTVRKLLVKKR